MTRHIVYLGSAERPTDFASAAISRCGISQGTDLVKQGGTKSLKGLKKALFTKAARWGFEMDVVESTDNTLYLDFHYCPLVKAWQKAGCSDAEIARLCDIAMCGDHGIGKCFDARLELPKAIAKGDDVCALRYIKSSDGQGGEMRKVDNSLIVAFCFAFFSENAAGRGMLYILRQPNLHEILQIRLF